MLRTLRHEEPVRIRYDNKTLQTSLFFLGNVPESSFSCVDGPTAVAFDGEVDGQHQQASFTVRYRALPVFCPRPRR